MEQETVSFSMREVRQRWEQVVKALMGVGIQPDALTFIALSLAVQSLAPSFGIVDDSTPKRRIGFNPGRKR